LKQSGADETNLMTENKWPVTTIDVNGRSKTEADPLPAPIKRALPQ